MHWNSRTLMASTRLSRLLGAPKGVTAAFFNSAWSSRVFRVGNPGGAPLPVTVPGTSLGKKPGWSGGRCSWGCLAVHLLLLLDTLGSRRGRVDVQKLSSAESGGAS